MREPTTAVVEVTRVAIEVVVFPEVAADSGAVGDDGETGARTLECKDPDSEHKKARNGNSLLSKFTDCRRAVGGVRCRTNRNHHIVWFINIAFTNRSGAADEFKGSGADYGLSRMVDSA